MKIKESFHDRNDTRKEEKCCHYLEYLRFIPDSQFIIKIIYNGLYAYLENRLALKLNENVPDERGDTMS